MGGGGTAPAMKMSDVFILTGLTMLLGGLFMHAWVTPIELNGEDPPYTNGASMMKGDAFDLRVTVEEETTLRICLFPLLMAVVVFACLLALVGEQGALGDLTGVLPVVLSSCFVVWAIVQGRGFGRWLSSVAASKLPEPKEREPGLSSRSTGTSFVVVILITVVLLYAFEMLADSSTTMEGFLLSNLVFLGIVSAVFMLAWRRSREVRLRASSRVDFHRFGSRWMFLSQLMITWHLLTLSLIHI